MKLKAKHLQFGSFRLYPTEHLLLRDDDTAVPLAPKTFEILLTLVRSEGRLITREELMKAVWPDSFVEETNLTVNISLLRKALGETTDVQTYIETVPRKGYRFKPEVKECDGEPEAAPTPVIVAAIPATTRPPHPVSPSPAITPRPRVATGRLALTMMGILGACWGLFLLFVKKNHPPAVSASVRSMAILPFRALDSAADDEYLGLGLTDALITRLGNLHQVVIRPVGAVRRYTAADDPIAAGKQLAVESVMEGSIQRLGDRTRVTARLLRVNDGEVLWSSTMDEKLTDMFAVEDAISQKVASAMTVSLTGDEQRRLTRAATGNGEAYQLYLKGRFFWNQRTVDGVKESLDYFEQAIDDDPNYALAYSGLADSYLLAGSYGYTILPPSQAMPKAKAAAEKALALDDALAEAHASLAYVQFTYDWNWAGAEQEFRRSIALNPGYATAHHWYAHELAALGRFPEALAESKLALELSPSEAVSNEHMGWEYLMQRDYKNTVPHCLRALAIDPNFVLAHRVLGLADIYLGNHEEAIAEFQKGVELSKGDPVAQAYLARSYALSGKKDQALAILKELQQLSKEQYVSPAEIAGIYTAFGQANDAFTWLDRAYQERTSALIYLKIDRVYDDLRSDPRFDNLLHRMNL